MGDDLEQEIIRQLAIIQNQQSILLAEMAVVKDKAHSPETCPLAKKVSDLRLSEARRGGIFVVIGFIAVGVTTFLFNLLLKAVAK